MKTPLQELIEFLELRAKIDKDERLAKGYEYSSYIAAWSLEQEKETIIKAYIQGYMDANYDDEQSLAHTIKGVEYFNNTFKPEDEEE